MTIRILCVLALILSTATLGSADDSEGPRATASLGYAPDNHPLTRGLVWIDLGYGVVGSYFNGEADLQKMGSGEVPVVGSIETNAKIKTTIVHVGGSYTLRQIGNWGLNLGADLGLAGQHVTADAVPGVVEGTDRRSGLTPQNLSLFGELASSNYTVRTGYLFDLARSGTAEGLETTDREHAVLMGVEGETSLQMLHLFGGVDYFVTLPAERVELRQSSTGVQRIRVDDRGNLLNMRIGVGLNYKAFDVGIMALYRINGRSGSNASNISQLAEFGAPNEFDRGNVFSLSPYLTLTPAQLPFQFSVKAALQREYHDYGYAIFGSNDIAPRFGGSFGVIYSF